MKGDIITIVKNRKAINVNKDNLCRNDIVILQTGDVVPADLKLVEAKELEIDEFELTGEIMPVMKKVDGSDIMIYMGSRIIKGTGKGIVVATETNKLNMEES